MTRPSYLILIPFVLLGLWPWCTTGQTPMACQPREGRANNSTLFCNATKAYLAEDLNVSAGVTAVLGPLMPDEMDQFDRPGVLYMHTGRRVTVVRGGRAEVHHTVLLNITLSAELGWLPDTIKVEPGGQLLLHRVDVYVSSCAALEGFRKELCISEDNRGPPLYVEMVPNSPITVSWHKIPGTEIVLEQVVYTCDAANDESWQDSSNRMQQCISTNLTSDADIVATSSYFSRFSSQVFIRLNESLYTMADRASIDQRSISATLSVIGVLPSPDAPLVEINVDRRAEVVAVTGTGLILFENVAFVNLPTGPVLQAPLNTLAALGWFMEFPRRALPNRLRTRCTNCLYHIPEEEAAWWAYWMQRLAGKPDRGMSDPELTWIAAELLQTAQAGLITVPSNATTPVPGAVGLTYGVRAVFFRAQFRSWELINSTLASGLPTKSARLPDQPGVLAKGIWGEPSGQFIPLSYINAFGATLSAGQFTSPSIHVSSLEMVWSGARNGATRLLARMHTSVADDGWLKGPLAGNATARPNTTDTVLRFDMAITGDMTAADSTHLDFKGGSGLVRVLPNVTVTLRALTLMNLANGPGGWGPGVVGLSPPGLANFTCPLWFFDGNRSPNASRPLVYLEHVTLLLPRDELAVLRALRAAAGGPGNLTSTSADAAAAARVDPQAAALLKQQLQGVAAQTLANGSLAFPGDVKLLGIWARNLTLRALPEPGSPEAAALPLVARQVNWSVLTLAAGAPGAQPNLLPPSPDVPRPPLVIGPPSLAMPAIPSGSQGTPVWAIVVAVLGAVLCMLLILATATLVWLRRQREQRAMYAEKMGGHGDAAMTNGGLWPTPPYAPRKAGSHQSHGEVHVVRTSQAVSSQGGSVPSGAHASADDTRASQDIVPSTATNSHASRGKAKDVLREGNGQTGTAAMTVSSNANTNGSSAKGTTRETTYITATNTTASSGASVRNQAAAQAATSGAAAASASTQAEAASRGATAAADVAAAPAEKSPSVQPAGGPGTAAQAGEGAGAAAGAAAAAAAAKGPPAAGAAAQVKAPAPNPAALDQPTPKVAHPQVELATTLAALKGELKESPVQLESVLGRGAHGVVYKGSWRGLAVAVKRLLIQQMAGPRGDAARQMALQEAALTVSLNHPNCVVTYSYDMQPLQTGSGGQSMQGGVQDWNLLLIQEFCDGGSLLDALLEKRYHRIPDADHFGPAARPSAALQPDVVPVLCLATNIACGMAYIHSKNIIHGDLKPDNILLKKDLSVPQQAVAKISDFGLSKLMPANRTHLSGVRHGTPLYVAPEVLMEGKTSQASDVYSFGVVLWELWHGCTAWDRMVMAAPHVAAVIQGGVPAAPPPSLFTLDTISNLPYREMCMRCLKVEPAARPQFQEVVNVLCDLILDQMGVASEDRNSASVSQVLSDRLSASYLQSPSAQGGGLSTKQTAAALLHTANSSVAHGGGPSKTSTAQTGRSKAARQPTMQVLDWAGSGTVTFEG